MKRITSNRKTASALILAACLLTASAGGAEDASWGRGFAGELRALAEGTSTKKLAAAAPETIKYLALHPDNPATLAALLRLRAAGAEGFGNIWWDQKSRSARAIITAFYLCAGDEEDAAPDFKGLARRFPPDEREKRTEELYFVLAHRSAVAELLEKAFKVADSEGHSAGAYAAYAVTARAGEGRALPR